MRTRITPNTDTFLRSAIKSLILLKLVIVGVRDVENLYKVVSHKEYVLLLM